MLGKDARVLVFSAHPADFVSRSGGTLAQYIENGGAAKGVVVTYGERGESTPLWRENPQIGTERVKKIRHEEIIKAASIIGVEVEFLDYTDYPLVIDKERTMNLATIMRDFIPDIVITHWYKDPTNPDHEVLSVAVKNACQFAYMPGIVSDKPPLPHRPRIFFFEPSVPFTPITEFQPDVFIDITDTINKKIEALNVIKAQPHLSTTYATIAERRGSEAKMTCGLISCKYAEAYRRFFPWGDKYFAENVGPAY